MFNYCLVRNKVYRLVFLNSFIHYTTTTTGTLSYIWWYSILSISYHINHHHLWDTWAIRKCFVKYLFITSISLSLPSTLFSKWWNVITTNKQTSHTGVFHSFLGDYFFFDCQSCCLLLMFGCIEFRKRRLRWWWWWWRWRKKNLLRKK